MAPSAGPTNLTSGLPTTGATVWRVQDEMGLIEFLAEHLAEAGDNKNFTPKTFHAAADHLEKTCTEGGPKTFKSCQQKYNSAPIAALSSMGQLWIFLMGADIDIITKDTWDDWVAKNPEGKRFRNRGWVHYDSLLPLMPEKAKGSHAFHGTAASMTPALPRSSSPDWDPEQLERDFGAAGEGDGDGAASGEGDAVGDGPAAPDNEDDENDADMAGSSSPVPTTGRKRVAAQSAGGHHKKSRLRNGAQGIVDLAAAAEDFNGIFAGVLAILGSSGGPTSTSMSAPDPAPALAPALIPATSSTAAFQTSPQRRMSAFKLAQQEDWMTPDERLELIEILQTDPRMVDLYVSLLTEDMRTPWIIKQLADYFSQYK
ncbi:hypothetical protein DFH08DRAFT_969817 [Mycena albidolilacea]|uniref:Myb/SANT-like domain-containing protein n=1 Tax=Mycena albidolilacea TaxID=1033008 RepID=A0AAD7EHR5_9AGAR|nr:hypothetical protein DFH08DRAFT_969817 [Mycena albidolilacea]